MPEEGRSIFKMQDSYYFAIESPIPLHHSAKKPEEAPISATDTSTMDNAVLDISISDLPEVSIPPPLSSPLPLQCLAANALPDQTKKEIESVIAEFNTSNSATDSSRREVCMATFNTMHACGGINTMMILARMANIMIGCMICEGTVNTS